MLIHEVCSACALTKKAVEYYIEQGLIRPSMMGNGYRNFSKNDLERLEKTAVLRGLGLSVSDIRTVLDSQSGGALNKVLHKKDMELSDLREKRSLIEKLAQDHDWQDARAQLEMIEKKQSVLKRLSDKFPGAYGGYLSLHFAPFLNEPIITRKQQEAFESVVFYLDEAHVVIPDDLQEYLDEASKIAGEATSGISESLCAAVLNTEQYMADNQNMLEEYMRFINSDEYKQSPACRLKELLMQFNHQSGYDDVFIPAMKKLSGSYRRYHDDLLKANEIFTKKYGNDLK